MVTWVKSTCCTCVAIDCFASTLAWTWTTDIVWKCTVCQLPGTVDYNLHYPPKVFSAVQSRYTGSVSRKWSLALLYGAARMHSRLKQCAECLTKLKLETVNKEAPILSRRSFDFPCWPLLSVPQKRRQATLTLEASRGESSEPNSSFCAHMAQQNELSRLCPLHTQGHRIWFACPGVTAATKLLNIW